MSLKINWLLIGALSTVVVMFGCGKETQSYQVSKGKHLYLDIHKNLEGLTAEAVAEAHKKDLEVEGKYGVKYLKYWYNEDEGTAYCLSEAPSKEAAIAVHREAHGMVPDEITEVKQGE
jgi:hypothetical protein